jgi:hypothetical protein
LEACGLITNFERERYFVEALAKILLLSVDQYRDPLDDYGRETGVDVIAVVGRQQIRFQVTEYDGGEGNSQMKPGNMRAAEVKVKREAGISGVYGGWETCRSRANRGPGRQGRAHPRVSQACC